MSMQRLVRIIDPSSSPVMSATSHQEMHDCYNKFMWYYVKADMQPKPKYHLLAHLIHDAVWHGNPRDFACFEDEGLNAVLKKIGQAAHRTVWQYRVLSHFGLHEEEQAPKRLRLR